MSALGSVLSQPWALWLLAPLVVPVLVAVTMWWRGRPSRPATTSESIAGHRDYLHALDPSTRTDAAAVPTRVAQVGIKRGG